ncbi:hypothetical protein J6590_104776, partial [Homalodisca vitripennis]
DWRLHSDSTALYSSAVVVGPTLYFIVHNIISTITNKYSSIATETAWHVLSKIIVSITVAMLSHS